MNDGPQSIRANVIAPGLAHTPMTARALINVPPKAKKGEIIESVKGAEGLDEALRNLKAQMVTTPPLSPAETHVKVAMLIC